MLGFHSLKAGFFMSKKVHLIINLTPEAQDAPASQIKERIKCESKIPWCKEIEEVTLQENDETYYVLTKNGISNNVARNILDLYNQK